MSARILVIEDNPDNLELMTYLLKAFGYTPLTACDGGEGLEVARRELPDLIICDIHLPTMDGYEVAHRLKKHQVSQLRKIPLIGVTALAMVGDREKVLAAGFDGYIAKPIVPETFVSQVGDFLQPALRSNFLQATASTTTEDAPLPRTKHATILVVDDSYVNRDLAYDTLGPSGYQVITAGSVQEGLALARQSSPDLILSDLHMPDEDGFSFIKAVKADPKLNSIPFVFLSSSVWGEKDKVTGLKLGAIRFILRPIEPQALLAEIDACLQKNKEK